MTREIGCREPEVKHGDMVSGELVSLSSLNQVSYIRLGKISLSWDGLPFANAVSGGNMANIQGADVF